MFGTGLEKLVAGLAQEVWYFKRGVQMVKSSVVLVEEHDAILHGKIIVQRIDEAAQPEIEDSFGNKHKIEYYIVMTEDTMHVLLEILKQPQVQQAMKPFLPEPFDSITVEIV